MAGIELRLADLIRGELGIISSRRMINSSTVSETIVSPVDASLVVDPRLEAGEFLLESGRASAIFTAGPDMVDTPRDTPDVIYIDTILDSRSHSPTQRLIQCQ